MDPESAPEFDEAFRNQLDSLLRWRRDVRHFRPDPLAAGTLEALVARAALAPSVGNSQPWRFVRVTDPARRAAVRAEFERCNKAALAGQDGERAALYSTLKLAGLDRAPEHLAVFCDEATHAGHGLGRATMPETLRYSAVGAVFALWLAARARGVGVGWVSILDPACVNAMLDVPASWSLVAYLCIGLPASDHDTPELERVGWQARDPRAAEIHAR
ncbi:MAG: 5,6-dimethylbenzimidazole synthase [Proteobacteria bacterium]|nr:5,6-dimethylbenzimidazole synthase [Pseudomonadota bacterium]